MIQTYVSLSKYPYIHLSHFEDRQNPLLAITLFGLHTSNVWSPISLLLVPYGLWTVFQSLHFSEESCKCQMIHNQTTSKSIIMEFSMRVSPMWPNAVPHMCGIPLVLRHLVSVLWMYHITINIHNIHPIHHGSMALLFFIILNNNCSFMNNTLATNIMQMG